MCVFGEVDACTRKSLNPRRPANLKALLVEVDILGINSTDSNKFVLKFVQEIE